jgi:beta-galactosidase
MRVEAGKTACFPRGTCIAQEPVMRILRIAIALCLAAAVSPLACGSNGESSWNGNGSSGGSSGASSGASSGTSGGASSGSGGGMGTGSGSGGNPGDGGGDDGGVPVGGPILDGGAPVTPPPPPNNRSTYNFDYGWKFIRQDVTGAEMPGFDDSAWTPVSLPHTFNDVDTWVDWVGFATDTPVMRTWEGKTWYRKHFTLDASFKDRKIFVEFQRVRDAGTFYVNGTKIGIQEDQISPTGLDITSAVQFGADNVIAVQVSNDNLEQDQTYAPGQTFDWSTQAFYPMYGGLVGDANLIVTDKLYQTLPLYRNLGTSGVYVHATNIDTLARSATLGVDAEVANEYTTAESATLSAELIDRSGNVVWMQSAAAQNVAPGQKATLSVSAPFANAHLWAPEFPYLYTMRTSLSAGGNLLDVVDTPFGIRKYSFSAADGFRVNGHLYWLKGYSPRTVMDWAVPGLPQNWMTEYDYIEWKQANAFFIRPMHVAPWKHMVDSSDRMGMIMVVPAGDGEGCYDTARWPQHLAVMQNVTIYFRNSPSVAFYEGCNSPLTQQQMLDMKGVRDKWDPYGGRFAGARGTDTKATPAYEYGSPMDGTGRSTTIPLWSAEYSREESPRRVWDQYTPAWDPHSMQYVTGGYVKIASPYYMGTLETTAGNYIAQYPLLDFRQNSTEDMALANVFKYWAGYSYSNFVEPMSTRMSSGIQIGGSKIFFADSDSDGRMKDTEVARVSGVVDGSRLPKSSYYAMRVAGATDPDIAILGHWNYPAGTVKTVYVIANTDQVTLATYDPSGAMLKTYTGAVDMQPGSPNHYVWAFPNVAFQAGSIKAVGTTGGTTVTDQKVTAGAATALKVTAVYGPKGWFADGADIVMADVEVVDSNGLRVPTDEANVTFTHSGAGQWLGGYNSGVRQSKFKDNIWTEAGINRVFVRSTTTAGTFTITASRPGLTSATATLTSQSFAVDASGLTQLQSQHYDIGLPAEPTPVADGPSSGGNPGGDAGVADAAAPQCTAPIGPNEQCTNGLPAPASLLLPAGFSMDVTEVTRSQYAAWLATNPSTAGQPAGCQTNTTFQPDATCMTSPLVCTGTCDTHPQVCVDWCDAQAYCTALGKQLCGARPDALAAGPVVFTDYNNAEKDQFQYACSADGKTSYVYGTTYSATDCNTGCQPGACHTIPVASNANCQGQQNTVEFPGVFDLNGNAAEWDGVCASTDPAAQCHVRGGDMQATATTSTCDYGAGVALVARNAPGPSIGFRCCSAQ